MDNSRIIELIARQTGKTATEAELQELNDLLSSYPHYAYLNEIIRSLKGNRDHSEKDIPREELVNQGWQHLEGRLNENTDLSSNAMMGRKAGLLKLIFSARRMAAAVLILLFAGATVFYLKHSYSKSPAAPSQVADTRYGTTSKLVLADGTQVWLNAGSRLIYPETFTENKREVTLEGEAFFEVTKNPASPFFVHAGKITVRVLGTTFNVKAYKEDADIETTLISGKVQVMLNEDPEKKIILSPHEKLTVAKALKQEINSSQKPVNELRYTVQALPNSNSNHFVETAWVDHKLVFNNELFDNVARILERRYNVHIHFVDDQLKQQHLSGVFEKENIEQVLEILKMTTRFNYSIEGNEIRLF